MSAGDECRSPLLQPGVAKPVAGGHVLGLPDGFFDLLGGLVFPEGRVVDGAVLLPGDEVGDGSDDRQDEDAGAPGELLPELEVGAGNDVEEAVAPDGYEGKDDEEGDEHIRH